MPSRIVVPRSSQSYVGRRAILEDLDGILELIDSSQSHILAVSGNAGIGKTRLTRELIDRFRHRYDQGKEFAGECFANDRDVPYGPIVDLLRRRMSSGFADEIQAEIGRRNVDLSPIVPDLRHDPVSDPVRQNLPRQELQHVLSEVIGAQLDDHPSLIIIEDLHWSDDLSLELIGRLAHKVRHMPVLIVLTYRDDEIQPGLQELLIQLDRARHLSRLHLEPLSKFEVDELISSVATTQQKIPLEIRDRVWTLSEGNPLYVEELISAYLADPELSSDSTTSSVLIPSTVEGAVQRRLDSIDEVSRTLLSTAAVAGRRFEAPLLLEVTDISERRLDGALQNLVESGIVVEESPDQFGFHHALIREAVYRRLLQRERRHLHLKVGKAIERLHSEPGGAHLVDLTYHYSNAGEWQKTLEYALQGATHARSMHDPRAAIEHTNRGLTAIHHLGVDPPVDLLIHHGCALADSGEFEPARHALEQARDEAHRARNARKEWEALTRLGLLWAARNYDRTGELYEAAHRLAVEQKSPAMIAHSLNRLGNWHMNRERLSEALVAHREALSLFEELGDQRGIAETNDLLGMTSFLGGDLIRGTDHYRRALRIFGEQGDLRSLSSCLATLSMRGPTLQTNSMITTEEPLSEGGIIDAREALQIAREIGWRDGEAYALLMLGFSRGASGDYDHALQDARLSLEISTAVNHRQWSVAARCVLGSLHLDLLDPKRAIDWFSRARQDAQHSASRHWLFASTGFLIQAHVANQDLELAGELLGDIDITSLPKQSLAQRLAWVGQVELLISRSQSDLALNTVDTLIEQSPHASIASPPLRFALLRASSLNQLERHDEALVLLKSTRDRAVRLNALGILWRVECAIAEIEILHGNREEALESIQRAQSIVGAIASRLNDPDLRRQFECGSARAMPDTPQMTATQELKRKYGGLTRRQREVVALIATGQTNRVIAASLSVSERTIESHITNILRTLNLTSRSQIAVWAVEHELVNHGGSQTEDRRG